MYPMEKAENNLLLLQYAISIYVSLKSKLIMVRKKSRILSIPMQSLGLGRMILNNLKLLIIF
ncbi:hypothetical protein MNBD_GAMMA07-1638 [hydrothermal vent metagenome]|uniref:Uncharacterized protein n=1 Tax=hydrothermal vent metagenome TaxID=652676 RepID=A0A3B0X8L6_9ZZZZ